MREDYYVDGVKYVVSATQYATGFYGSWVCEECGTAGTHALPLTTAEDAILHAKQNLLDHHNSNHKSGS
jgi:hypothetical protein